MGDMADYYNEMLDPDYDDPEPFQVKCKYCGLDQLDWAQMHDGKWRLADRNGKVHDCPQYGVKVLASKKQ